MTHTHNHKKIQTPFQTVAGYVQQWGSSPSIALLDPACKIFKAPHIDGIIGYRGGSLCNVVVGEPLCSQAEMPVLYHAFQKYCQEEGKKIIYLLTSEEFAKWAKTHACRASLQLAQELFLDPVHNPLEGAKGRKLRNKISHSQRTGVTIHEYVSDEPSLERDMENTAKEWLKGRHGPQIYLANVHLFNERQGKRWFYAKMNDRIIGVLLLNRLEKRSGWLYNLLMTSTDAPWGTSEMLAMHTLTTLRDEGCRFVSFGVVPGRRIKKIEGLGIISSCLARIGYKVSNWFFALSGRKKYWEKFHPQCESTYILLNDSHMGIREIIDILRAFNASL